jgi:putative nucleotidyltransferase with HDIG domain
MAPGDPTSFKAEASPLLSALDRHDDATRDHCDSVAGWSRRIAKALGLSPVAVQFVERCALLHDVGKLLTPDHILKKPGLLTASEWNRMKDHAADGATILQDIPVLASYASVVRSHHERYDGRGYPEGLRGTAIPLGARIVSVAGAFDAMIGKRSYGEPLAPSAAIAELQRNRGSQFEPAIVDCLVSVVQARRGGLRQSSGDSDLGSREAKR